MRGRDRDRQTKKKRETERDRETETETDRDRQRDRGERERIYTPCSFFLVCSSKISNLFARDEMDEITQGLISVMKRELPRHPPTFDNLYEYFITRSRKNLHVVLCFSPVSLHCSCGRIMHLIGYLLGRHT